MTEEQVVKLISDMESDWIERTRSTADDKLGPAICAFSNDFPNHKHSGYLLLGVENEGTFSGKKWTDDDLQKLGGMKIQNLGTTLNIWKRQWAQRKDLSPPNLTFQIPMNNAVPSGYILMQYSAKESRPVKSYLLWANRIPDIYSKYMLGLDGNQMASIENDENCIALLKHYRSLAPMAMEAHQPMLLLKPADGAIGAHLYAVKKCYEKFEELTNKILDRCPDLTE